MPSRYAIKNFGRSRNRTMKRVCHVCEELIVLPKGKALKKCSVCHQPICNSDIFPCCICGNEVCVNDIVNYDPEKKNGKTSQWKFFKCKSCAKTEKQVWN